MRHHCLRDKRKWHLSLSCRFGSCPVDTPPESLFLGNEIWWASNTHIPNYSGRLCLTVKLSSTTSKISVKWVDPLQWQLMGLSERVFMWSAHSDWQWNTNVGNGCQYDRKVKTLSRNFINSTRCHLVKLKKITILISVRACLLIFSKYSTFHKTKPNLTFDLPSTQIQIKSAKVLCSSVQILPENYNLL